MRLRVIAELEAIVVLARKQGKRVVGVVRRLRVLRLELELWCNMQLAKFRVKDTPSFRNRLNARIAVENYRVAFVG